MKTRRILTFAQAAAISLALPAIALAAPAQVENSAKGKILADAQGMSLYTFDKDSAGKSACTGGCAVAWPPLIAKASATASGDWSLIKRSGGTLQWAYKGKPLYAWQGDHKAGDITGDGFKGVWHIARP